MENEEGRKQFKVNDTLTSNIEWFNNIVYVHYEVLLLYFSLTIIEIKKRKHLRLNGIAHLKNLLYEEICIM